MVVMVVVMIVVVVSVFSCALVAYILVVYFDVAFVVPQFVCLKNAESKCLTKAAMLRCP